MVRCWYMDDGQDNPKEEHLLTEVDVATVGSRTGVQVFYFPSDQVTVENECSSLTKLKQDRGYTYEDQLTINSSVENYEEKIKMYYREHIHSDEEIRLVLDGSGFFDVRDCDDKWIRVHVFPGDLLILPAGIYHRFSPDTKDYICARRFFVGEPVWRAINRPDGDIHPARKGYLEQLSTAIKNSN